MVVDPDGGRKRAVQEREVVARIVTREGVDEIGPFVVRVLEGIGVGSGFERIVGQSRLDVLEGDRAVEAKL